MGFRLTIAAPPVIAAPTPHIARKIETWDAKANPDTPQVVVPVVPPPRAPLDPRAALGSFLTRWFPRLKPEMLTIPPYITALIENGFGPADGPAPDWALLEVWGHFEMAQTRAGKMAGQPPGNPLTIAEMADGLRKRPVEHFCALVLQSRGRVTETKAVAAYALHPYPDAYMHALTGKWP